MGSPHLDPFLAQHADLLACDYVLSADGGQISETQPSLSLGLRCVGGGSGAGQGRAGHVSRVRAGAAVMPAGQ